MQNLECPRCQKSGKVKAKGRNATITCPLCKGTGEIPPLHAVVKNETSLALYYWECTCEIKKFGMTLSYVHPSNHQEWESVARKQRLPRSPLQDTPRRSTSYSTIWTWTSNIHLIKLSEQPYME